MAETKIQFPAATLAIAGILILTYVLFSSALLFPQFQVLENFALSSQNILNIFFHAFFHSSYSHLIANLCMILFAGIIVEPIIGRKHVIAIFIFGSVVSGISFVAFNQDTAILGASGGGVALLTAAIISNPQKAMYSIAIALVISFVLAQAISFFVDRAELGAKIELAKLESEKEAGIANEAEKIQTQAQIDRKTTQLEEIAKGKQIEREIRPNFELHAFGSIFAAFYMFFFQRQVVKQTVKSLSS